MIVTCPDCGKRYDDESRWTICPHNSLNVAYDTPYCRLHDLYNCGLCKGVAAAPYVMPPETTDVPAVTYPLRPIVEDF